MYAKKHILQYTNPTEKKSVDINIMSEGTSISASPSRYTDKGKQLIQART